MRKATRQDRHKLAEFFKHYGKLAEQRAECYTTHNNTIIEEDGNKIIGCIQWTIKEDPNKGLVEIEELYVEPEHRKKGIATRLIATAVEDAKQELAKNGFVLKKAFLYVSEDNITARKAYEKNGFKKTADAGDLFGTGNQTIYSKEF